MPNKVLAVALLVALLVAGCMGSPPEPTKPAIPAEVKSTAAAAVEKAATAIPKVVETAVALGPQAAETAVADVPKAVETAAAIGPSAAQTAVAAVPTGLVIPGIGSIPGLLSTRTPTAATKPGPGAAETDAFISALRAGGLPIADVETYTAESDPERLLGRPNQYTAKAAWRDTRINASGTPGKKPTPGLEGGGIVEIFANEADRQTRQTYLTEQAKQPNLSQYVYGKGRTLVRVSRELTPTQAAEYERVLAGFAG